ncbi:MAG: hypothetical protein ABIT58_06875 [Ferruginibacter sp.]
MTNKTDNTLLWKYAGLATQFLVGIGLSIYAGMKIDKWLKINMPVAVWVLPLLVIVAVIIKIIKDTARKK